MPVDKHYKLSVMYAKVKAKLPNAKDGINECIAKQANVYAERERERLPQPFAWWFIA